MDRLERYWFTAWIGGEMLVFSVYAEDDIWAWRNAERLCGVRGWSGLAFADQRIAAAAERDVVTKSPQGGGN